MNDDTFTGYTLDVGLSVRMKEACEYASDRGIELSEALAELINKGLIHTSARTYYGGANDYR